ncbi:hypothetical protein [Saccharothrix lopnurensis]|uniref:Uncharacterized protein n=1 Tax=Saccharothrix lopnurensis TaxID=1670621 RepID=A0ABW1P2V9_9PSEU
MFAGRPGGVELPDDLAALVREWRGLGRTVIAVVVEDRPPGLPALTDRVKPTSAEAVRGPRALGLEPILPTGDGVNDAPAPTRGRRWAPARTRRWRRAT